MTIEHLMFIRKEIAQMCLVHVGSFQFPFEDLQISLPEAMLDNRSIQCSAERVIAISVIVLFTDKKLMMD